MTVVNKTSYCHIKCSKVDYLIIIIIITCIITMSTFITVSKWLSQHSKCFLSLSLSLSQSVLIIIIIIIIFILMLFGSGQLSLTPLLCVLSFLEVSVICAVHQIPQRAFRLSPNSSQNAMLCWTTRAWQLEEWKLECSSESRNNWMLERVRVDSEPTDLIYFSHNNYCGRMKWSHFGIIGTVTFTPLCIITHFLIWTLAAA